jgi:hypothetical protein
MPQSSLSCELGKNNLTSTPTSPKNFSKFNFDDKSGTTSTETQLAQVPIIKEAALNSSQVQTLDSDHFGNVPRKNSPLKDVNSEFGVLRFCFGPSKQHLCPFIFTGLYPRQITKPRRRVPKKQ